jgi:hypothetical protein
MFVEPYAWPTPWAVASARSAEIERDPHPMAHGGRHMVMPAPNAEIERDPHPAAYTNTILLLGLDRRQFTPKF